jgi:hypothetical protein
MRGGEYTMELILPSWFKQRQGKAEPVGPDTYRLTGPNLPDAYLGVRRTEDGRYAASLRFGPDGPEAASTQQPIDTLYEAWEAAFELYRSEVIV